MRTIVISIIFGLATLVTVSGQDPRDLIRKSHDAVKVKSFEAVATLTITDSRDNQRIRENTMASMTTPDGTEKRIIKFLSPPEVRGTGILIFDYPEKSDDMWIYLPALRKTRRIVSSEKSKSFMGSEFSNADMTAPGLDDFTYEMLGEGTVDGTSCYQIQSTPASRDLEDEYGYARSVRWVNKNNYLVQKTEYYNFDGDLFKTIENKAFKELDPENHKYMVTHMIAQNLSSGRRSEMVMEKVAVTATDPSYFTVSFLEKE